MPTIAMPNAGLSRAPTADDLVAIGERVLASLPDTLRALLGDLPIMVQDWPDDRTLDGLGIDNALELTGLFHGLTLAEREAGQVSTEPDLIFLYRLPILHEWCERGCVLQEVVFDVLTHEIGHRFGMNEDEVLRMEGRL